MSIQRVITATILFATVTALHAAPNILPCKDQQKIHKRFPSGATWDFCWTIKELEGLNLSHIYYAAPHQAQIRILGEASLAEILTVPDKNMIKPTFSITQHGLGGSNSIIFSSEDCPNGNLRKLDNEYRLCRATHTYSHHYRTNENSTRQGAYFEIFTASQVHSRSYINRWRFYENGVIEPSLGASGTIPNNQQLTNENFLEHAIWRLDFDIGPDATNDIVEEISSTPTQLRLKKEKKTHIFRHEAARTFDPETKRFWRIRDGLLQNIQGSFISYELVPLSYSHSRSNVRKQAWLNNDIYITKHHSCERYAAKNHTIQSDCKFNLMNYINDAESLRGENIVVWYKQSLHHLQRDENRNRVGTTWNTFQLLPRDWHATNPF